MQRNKLTLLILITFIVHTSLPGQKLINSPFSRFNLGTLEQAASFRSLGMGGTGTAIRDNSSILFVNPASYSGLDTASFVFDFGMDFALNTLKEGDLSYSTNDMNFDHLILGFPLSKGIGFAAGIVNISNGYYRINEVVKVGDPGYDEITGGYSSDHSGNGGFTRVFLGTGLNLTKNFSAGANLNVLFGAVSRENMTEFADYYNVYHYSNSENLKVSGINFDLGLQYRATLAQKYFMNAGLSLGTGSDYNSEYQSISFRYNAYGSKDTLTYNPLTGNKSYIPGTLRIGLAGGRKDQFTVAADFISTRWTKTDLPGTSGVIGDTRELHLGVEYIPEKLANYNIMKRMEYRAGFHTGDNYLVLNGSQVSEKGFTLGLGIPMKRQLSKTNLFFDYTIKNAVSHSETFILFGASLNFYDSWFIKRRYN